MEEVTGSSPVPPTISYWARKMIEKKLLHNLYFNKKLSMVQVADKLKITPRKVEYWLKKYNIQRRSCSESAYVKQNPNGDPFKIKRRLNLQEKELLAIGLILYWAEGSKAKKSPLQLVNLDHRMLQLFLRFLREICRIDETRLRLYVRLYKAFDRKTAKIYWSGLLDIPEEQVFIYSHTDKRSKANKQWSKYGIATLQFGNTKLKKWLDDTIESYLSKQIYNGKVDL